MAEYLPPVVGTLKMDNSDWVKGNKEARDDIEKTDKESSKHLDSMKSGVAGAGKAMAVGLAVGATAIVGVGAALFKLGGTFDDAYDKIRVGTGATGANLDQLKDDFRNVVGSVPTDFASASDAITQLSQRTGYVGPALQDMSKQMLELSRITETDLTANIKSTQDAFASWGVDLEHQPKLLDEMFRASQLTGISVDKLAAQVAGSQPQLNALGFSFERSAALAGTLAAAGMDLGDVMPAMSKAMATAAKEGRPAALVLDETFKAIKDAPTSTAAAGKALEVFGGKAGPKLAQMIRSGKLEYEDLLTSMQNGTDTIIGAGEDTADFAEKWQLFKNRVLLTLEPLAARVFDAVGKAMDKVAPAFERFMGWLGVQVPVAIAFLQPKITDIGQALARAFSWFSDNVLPVLITGVTRFGAVLRDDVWPATQTVFGFMIDHKEILAGIAIAVGVVLVGAFIAWAVSTWAVVAAQIALWAPVIAIGLAIGALAAGVIYAYKHWGWFHDAVDAVAGFLRDKLLPAVADVAAWVKDKLVPAVVEAVGWLADHLGPVFKETGRVIRDDIVPAVKSIIEWLGKAGAKIGEWAGILASWVVEVWKVGGQVLDFFRELPGKIGDGFITLANAITAPFRMAFNGIVDLWNNTVGSLSFNIPDWVPGVGGKGWSAPRLQHWESFDVGGIIPGRPGEPVGIIAHGGEEILRQGEVRARDNDRGATIFNLTVYGGLGVDGPALGKQIINEIVRAESVIGADWRAA